MKIRLLPLSGVSLACPVCSVLFPTLFMLADQVSCIQSVAQDTMLQ